jgi:hypothetical protein
MLIIEKNQGVKPDTKTPPLPRHSFSGGGGGVLFFRVSGKRVIN